MSSLPTHGPPGAPIETPVRALRRRRLAFMVPIALFAMLAAVLGLGLTLDPHAVPSPLIGKRVPEFALPPVKGRTLGLATPDLTGAVSLVNVFASWCVACRAEHPVLIDLARQKVVAIYGLDYKDAPDDAPTGWTNGATPTPGPEQTLTAAQASTGAYTAFRKPSSSVLTAVSPTNTSAR